MKAFWTTPHAAKRGKLEANAKHPSLAVRDAKKKLTAAERETFYMASVVHRSRW